MAPGIYTEEHASKDDSGVNDHAPEPLKPTGVLEKFDYVEVTPLIGREFPTLNIFDDILNAENADELIRELAITISRRGVVFFRSQHNLTDTIQKNLIHRLGQIAQKPQTSKLHIHPILNSTSEFGVADSEISIISSVGRKSVFAHDRPVNRRQYDSAQWHSDIQFENFPADYTSLRLTQLPGDERSVPTGGDTLWASGYELYDRFSKPYQKFLEGLTATFTGDGFLRAAAVNPSRVIIHEGPRGNPANVGGDLTAVHPVVRTNPVTGWKSVFAVGPFPKRINELYPDESDELLTKLKNIVATNHDLQVRLKWKNEGDLAIWDNRSVFHTATFDYEGLGERTGNRAVGIGERPYFNVNSRSRTEALAEEAAVKDKLSTKKVETESKEQAPAVSA